MASNRLSDIEIKYPTKIHKDYPKQKTPFLVNDTAWLSDNPFKI